jgi:hypothetical protein
MIWKQERTPSKTTSRVLLTPLFFVLSRAGRHLLLLGDKRDLCYCTRMSKLLSHMSCFGLSSRLQNRKMIYWMPVNGSWTLIMAGFPELGRRIRRTLLHLLTRISD